MWLFAGPPWHEVSTEACKPTDPSPSQSMVRVRDACYNIGPLPQRNIETALSLRSSPGLLNEGRHLMSRAAVLSLQAGLVFALFGALPAHAGRYIVGWGDDTFGQLELPLPTTPGPFVAVSAGSQVTRGITGDGTIVQWGVGGENYH